MSKGTLTSKEAPRDPHAHPRKYRYNKPHYCKVYNVPTGTLQRWYDKNYPLDSPKSLLRTLQEQKGTKSADLTTLSSLAHLTLVPGPRAVEQGLKPKLPKELDDAVTAYEEETTNKTKPRTPSSTSNSTPDDIDSTLTGFHRELARLQAETDQVYRDYKASKDPIARKAYWDIWNKMLEQWGKLAKIAPDAEREAGSLIKVSDVESAWSRTCKEFRTTLETIPRRIALHPVFSACDRVAAEQTLMMEINQAMTGFEAGGYHADS